MRKETLHFLRSTPSMVIMSSISGSVPSSSSAYRHRPPDGRVTTSSTLARMALIGWNTRSNRTTPLGGTGGELFKLSVRLCSTIFARLSGATISKSMMPSVVGITEPVSVTSMVFLTTSRARHENRPSVPLGGASATPTMGNRQVSLRAGQAMEMVQRWSTMRRGWNMNASCWSLNGLTTMSRVLPLSREKTSATSSSASRAAETVMGNPNGLRKSIMFEDEAPMAQVTVTWSMSEGSTPRPCTLYTQSPATSSWNDIVASSTSDSELGVYTSGTSAWSQGAIARPWGGMVTL
mmetsp:Transcript_28943/g.66990  ORF Transcript_28943/g.66990 Transcript_28943/m.66990 type:complete len:293 (-) Transcript_28943:7307-8185(-)